jgi:hypothetical protein
MVAITAIVMITSVGGFDIARWNWNAISAIAGSVAALAACYALVQVARSTRATQALEKQTRLGQHFDALVTSDVLTALGAFTNNSRELVTTFCTELDLLRANSSPFSLVEQSHGTAIQSFNAFLYELRDVVFIATEAWDDPSLKNAMRLVVEDLQDQIVMQLARLPTSPSPDEAFRILKTKAAEIRRIILRHDPVLANDRSAKALPKVAR